MNSSFRPSVLAPLLVSLVLLMVGPLAAAESAGAFQALDLEAARTKAQAEGKLVFVDAWATWCGPCKMLDATTWQDRDVVKLLQGRTVAIKIDVDQNPEFATTYQLEAIPTLLVLRPDGTEVARLVGYADAAKFRAFLEPKVQ